VDQGAALEALVAQVGAPVLLLKTPPLALQLEPLTPLQRCRTRPEVATQHRLQPLPELLTTLGKDTHRAMTGRTGSSPMLPQQLAVFT
jgi:hypothetical protein